MAAGWLVRVGGFLLFTPSSAAMGAETETTMAPHTRKALFYLALGIMQGVHSAEEYLTRLWHWFPVVTGYVHEATGLFPIINMSEQTFVILNITLVAGLLSLTPFVFQNRTWASRLATILAVVEIVNGLAHLSAAVYVAGYYPGTVSAMGLTSLGVVVARS